MLISATPLETSGLPRMPPVTGDCVAQDDQEHWRLAAAPGQSSGAPWAGAHHAFPPFGYRARPALACIIGARRVCRVEMISSEEIPCRYVAVVDRYA